MASVRLLGIFALVIAAIAVVSASIENDKFVVSQELIDKVNNDESSSWTAGVNSRFKGWTVEQARGLMGFKRDELLRATLDMDAFKARGKANKVQALPTSFDARTKWPGCVGPIVDQGDCGSCWAFGATESLQDRFCIDSNGKHFNLSEQEVVSCVDGGLEGCGGGEPLSAFTYLSLAGVVDAPCIPYTSGKNGDTGSCPWSCTNSSATWVKHYAKLDSISSYDTVIDMQNAIYTYGPIEGCFTVYQDFMNYKSGVYSHTTGNELGGHCIKVLGWGVDTASNKPYWICANSWGPSWGLNGYFWIERGVDECGIEDDAWSAMPSV